MGNRKVVQQGHVPLETSIPDDAEFWFDIPETGAFPRRAQFSLIGQPAVASGGYTPIVMAALPQSITGAGAVNVTSNQTNYTSDGAAQALTLADGTIIGQMKSVTHVADGGSGVLTPANFADGSTITFTNVMEEWVGVWTGTTWQTVALNGVTTLPAIA